MSQLFASLWKVHLLKVKYDVCVRYNRIVCVLRTDLLRTAYRLTPPPKKKKKKKKQLRTKGKGVTLIDVFLLGHTCSKQFKVFTFAPNILAVEPITNDTVRHIYIYIRVYIYLFGTCIHKTEYQHFCHHCWNASIYLLRRIKLFYI